MKTFVWDMTPTWWSREWWLSHQRSRVVRMRDGRDASAVGYIVEIILEDTAPGATLKLSESGVEVTFEADPEAYLQALNEEHSARAAEFDATWVTIDSMEAWRVEIMKRIDWVCGPRSDGVSVAVHPPSPRIRAYSQFGQVRLDVDGLQPGNGSFGVTSSQRANDYEALREAFLSAADMTEKVRQLKEANSA